MNAEGSRDAAPARPWRTWAFNPFHFVAGVKALAVGLAAILVAGAVNSRTGSHFDGVLDFHTGAVLPWWTYWVEGPINWIILSALLLPAGWILSKSRVRPIDVLGTQALARIPTLVMALSVWPPFVQRANQRMVTALLQLQQPGAVQSNQEMWATLHSTLAPMDMVISGVVVLIILTMLVWMLILMYRAFAVSCNVSGGKAVGAFIVLLVAAEILSKIVLGFVYYLGST